MHRFGEEFRDSVTCLLGPFVGEFMVARPGEAPSRPELNTTACLRWDRRRIQGAEKLARLMPRVGFAVRGENLEDIGFELVDAVLPVLDRREHLRDQALLVTSEHRAEANLCGN